MKVHVARWGNSTGMRFPKSVVDELGLVPGVQLDLVIEGPEIRLRRRRKTSRELLEELAAEARRLGPEHEPEPVEWGPERGSEIIDDEYTRGLITLEDVLRHRDARAR